MGFKEYLYSLATDKRKGLVSSICKFILFLLSLVYCLVVRTLAFFYSLKPYQAKCKVISVGNITLGGTGKTILVEYIARLFKEKGQRIAIVTRGYGRVGIRESGNPGIRVESMGDEAYMLSKKLGDIPIIVDADRIRAIEKAVKDYAVDTVILDDAFQQWKIKKDLEIVAIDATNPFGNKHILPRGILREPLSALRRADIFILTKTNLNPDTGKIKVFLNKINPMAEIFESAHKPMGFYQLDNPAELLPIDKLGFNLVSLFSGIGAPDSFENLVKNMGINVGLSFRFPDHYNYTQQDLDRIIKESQDKNIDTIITTEKDAARLKNQKILALKISLTVASEQGFQKQLFLNTTKRVLILDDGKTGHLRQSEALAKILINALKEKNVKTTVDTVRVEFRSKLSRIALVFSSYFAARPFCRGCLYCFGAFLKPAVRSSLLKIKPDIIISCGSSVAMVNLIFSRASLAKSIVIMRPAFLSTDRFNLVVMPRHDNPHKKKNIVVIDGALNLIDEEYLKEQTGKLLKTYDLGLKNSGSYIGLLLGGDAKNFKLEKETVAEVIRQLKVACEKYNAGILITTSRRTPTVIEKLIKEEFKDYPYCKLLIIANELNIPEAVGGILGLSKIVVVSPESISMISEAASSGKHILTFPSPVSKKHQQFLRHMEEKQYIRLVLAKDMLNCIDNIFLVKAGQNILKDGFVVKEALLNRII